MKMRDRVTITKVTSQTSDGAGGYLPNPTTSSFGPYWCYLLHKKNEIKDRNAQPSSMTDFEVYLRKKTADSVTDGIQKGDTATFETPALTGQINQLLEVDQRTIKLMVSTIE